MNETSPVMNALAEQRIQEAQQRGDFDALSGSGRPLALEDEPLVPPEVRAIYRVLKHAGFVPPEVQQLREAAELEARMPQLKAEERSRALQKLSLLRIHIGETRFRNLHRDREYGQKILRKLGE